MFACVERGIARLFSGARHRGRLRRIDGDRPPQQRNLYRGRGKIAAAVENVRDVHNATVVALPSSLTSRSNDALLTSKVKLNFTNNKRFSPNHVKVVTENEVVYLLGLVKRAEADAASEIASTTGGVRKVVRMFEYLD